MPDCTSAYVNKIEVGGTLNEVVVMIPNTLSSYEPKARGSSFHVRCL